MTKLAQKIATPEADDVPIQIPADFTGTVDDVDYGPESTQVLVRTQGANLAGKVQSDLLQDVLQAAFVSRREVRVTHYNQAVTRVIIMSGPTICPEGGCVLEIDATAAECTALIEGEPGRVRATDRRSAGVLLTAISSDLRVQELLFDDQRVITRVKVNAESAPEA